MRRILVLVFSLQLSVFSLLAADITPQEALDIANQFVQHDQVAQKAIRRAPAGTTIAPTIAHRMSSRVAQNKDNVYIVNLGNDQGFVVVSGETGTTAQILGYCDHGSFNYDDAPIQLKDLLDYYVEAVDTLRMNPEMADPQTQNKSNARKVNSYPSYMGNVIVEPLLKSTWNQCAPYNDKCPIVLNPNGSGYGNHAPNGCAPTAIAQVMYYWKWPKVAMGEVTVMNPDSTYSVLDFSTHTYDWDNMLDNYGDGWKDNGFGTYEWLHNPYTSVQADAVATLMYDIGLAMHTKYGQPNGSPTPWLSDALNENFGYDINIETHSGETGADVAMYIKADLDQNRPVPFCGCPKNGDCHALVCDGYTSNEYYHFNYGWGGNFNGFYLLTALRLYTYNVTIFSGVFPYEATPKVIDGIKYGLKHDSTAEIMDFVSGQVGVTIPLLVIPDTVEDEGIKYAVTRIRQRAFYRKGYISKLVMGNNIEAIDAYGFMNTRIDTLVLSDQMEVVPDLAFQTAGIKHLTIGANVKRIGKRAFYLCRFSNIISKSPAFEVDEGAFESAFIPTDEWLNSITILRKKAFYGAQIQKWRDLQLPNLEVIGDSAFSSTSSSSGTPVFQIHAKVKEIAKSAFDGWNNATVTVNSANPYFYGEGRNIYNKSKTSLVLSFSDLQYGCPETLVRLEPGCFRPSIGEATIPGTIVEMEGAFRDCEVISYGRCTCQCVVPPQISDETFNDKIFVNSPSYLKLYVPAGTEDLYRQAPGWRKFNIIGDQPYTPMAAQGMEYRMVVVNDSADIKVATKDVNRILLSEDEDGEPMVDMSFNGRPNILTAASRIDSIVFKPGFVYDNAEIFELTDSTHVVHAQSCDILIAPTVIDEDVELCVRSAVITPKLLEGAINCTAIDLSLSNGTHELSGTMEMRIPIKAASDELVVAAYYNEELGEWQPVYNQYDRQNGILTIRTNHLSLYATFKVLTEDLNDIKEAWNDIPDQTKKDMVYFLHDPVGHVTCKLTTKAILAIDWSYTPAGFILDYNCKQLLKFMLSDDPEAQWARETKTNLQFMQSIGIDGLYNWISGAGEPWGFAPEKLNSITQKLGYMAIALNILDVVDASLHDDDVATAANTLSTILNVSTAGATSVFATPILSASMGCVAFIGVALNHLGTTVQAKKVDLFRAAYRYYYSLEGYKALSPESKYKENQELWGDQKFPHSYFRTPKDWYDYFYPAFQQGRMNEQQLNDYISQSVRMYTQRFWSDNESVRTWAYAWARTQGLSTYMYDTEELRTQISNEYYAELMNSEIPRIIESIKDALATEAFERYAAYSEEFAKQMNTKVKFRFVDSSWKQGEVSKYKNWWVEFAEIPQTIEDPENLKRYLTEKGRATMELTVAAIAMHELKNQIVLLDSNMVEQKIFEYEIPDGTGQVVVTIDVDKDGVIYDMQHLDSLKLDYTPDSVVFPFNQLQYNTYYDPPVAQVVTQDAWIYVTDMDGWYKHTRFRTEIERFFNRHNFVTVDASGHIKIGEDIVGQMNGDVGTGTFTINTEYVFREKTFLQYVTMWNTTYTNFADRVYALDELLNGTMKHNIECQFELQRVTTEEGAEAYEITYTGTGTYLLEATVINYWGVEFHSSAEIINPPHLTEDDFATGNISGGGDVSLYYKTLFIPHIQTTQPEEQSE